MVKSFLGLSSVLCLMAGCAANNQSAQPQAAAGHPATVASANSSAAADDQDYDTVFVPPPVGSLLGGGVVRVPRTYNGNDERSVVGNIRRLNAAAGSQNERPYVVNAVSRVTGVSERALQAQQDRLQLRFGELCAINAIAHGNDSKVQQIATLKASGRTWTDIARANGLSVAAVAQATRSASELTANRFTNNEDRRQGGQRKIQDLGVHPQVIPGQ